MQLPAFKAYRKAFSNLLDCAAGDAGKNLCVDGWINDASTLIGAKDMSYARTLVDFYVENYLRHTSERMRRFCTD